MVLQEISQAEDTPDDFIHDLFNLKFWEGHQLALPIFGSVSRLSREAMLALPPEEYDWFDVHARSGLRGEARRSDENGKALGALPEDQVIGEAEPEPAAEPEVAAEAEADPAAAAVAPEAEPAAEAAPAAQAEAPADAEAPE